MVINGGARSSTRAYAAWLGAHLTRTDSNERVLVRNLDGVAALDLAEAILEMSAMAAGARSRRGLYHANIDWRHDEQLTPEQKDQAVRRLADELGLAGQPCAVVEHVKDGREHLHAVWMRIDPETQTAISDAHNFRRHEIVARELEREFGLERVQGVHIEREGIERPARTPEAFEFAQAARSGITPAEAKAELTGLWRSTDSGRAFVAAIEEAGWMLARGDKRDFVVLDRFGETHSLARRIDGAKAKEIRDRLADIDAGAVPSVDQARQAMRDRQAEAAQPVPEPMPEMGGPEVAAPMPEATQRASYEAEAGPEPAYVPNFVLVVDLADLEARWAPSPEIDPEAGMVIDVEPEPSPEIDLAARQAAEFTRQDRQWADIEAEATPQHRQAKPHQVEPEAVRWQEPAHGPERSAMDNEARRAMEDLARTDPLGMAARHGFHAGDRLKSPEEMRREWADRLRSATPEPVPEMGGAEAAPSPEATHGASYEVGPEPKPLDIGRFAGIVAAARAKLADLAERLDVAFTRLRDQVLKAPAEITPRPQPEARKVDDNAAVILEAMRQQQREPEPPPRARSVAEELLEAGRRRRQEKGPEPDLDQDFGPRRRRMPWEPSL